jgi:hypothetical protein
MLAGRIVRVDVATGPGWWPPVGPRLDVAADGKEQALGCCRDLSDRRVERG